MLAKHSRGTFNDQISMRARNGELMSGGIARWCGAEIVAVVLIVLRHLGSACSLSEYGV
jgi:hypothetical protein